MHLEDIILITNDSAILNKIKSLFDNEYNVIITSQTEAIATLEKNPHISNIIFDMNEGDIEALRLYVVLQGNNVELRFFVLVKGNIPIRLDEYSGNDFYASIEGNDDQKIKNLFHHFITKSGETPLASEVIRNAIENLPIGIGIFQFNKLNKTLVNKHFLSIVSYSREEFLKNGLSLFEEEDGRGPYEFTTENTSQQENYYAFEKRITRGDGEVIWVYLQFSSIGKNKDGDNIWLVVLRRIAKTKELEMKLQESYRAQKTVFHNLPGLAYRCKDDEFWTMNFVSIGARTLTGYEPEDFIDNAVISFNDIIVPKYRKGLRTKWGEVNEENPIFEAEYEIVTKNGTKKWVLERGVPIYDEEGNITALEGLIIDINHTKSLEQKLQTYNYFNHELKLPNRHLLLRRMAAKQNSTRKDATLFLINLKDTQKLYRTHGYEYVKLLTTSLVTKIKEFEESSRILYYAEEDIYVFLIKSKLTEEEIRVFYKQIVEGIARTVYREQIRCQVGVTFITKDSKDMEDCLQRARIASEYRREENRLINLNIYNLEMQENLKREEDLKRELIDVSFSPFYGNLRLVFQPIINLKTGKIVSYEALARYKSETHGNISPVEFIPIVEKNRLIVAFGKKITSLALIFIKKLQNEGYNNIPVSVNVSTLQLLDKDFIGDLFARLDEAKVDRSQFIVEVTESIFSANFKDLNDATNALIEGGIKTAIDDFGTGFSTLSRIEKLRFNTVKLDRSFIEPLSQDTFKNSIVPEIIQMCNKFKLSSLAEGIETKEQLDLLIESGCELGQGYYISRPLEFDDALNFIKKSK